MAEFELQEYMEEFERVFPDMKDQRGTPDYMKELQDYFEGLEDSILTQAKLKSLVSNSGFKAPEGYLDNFEVVIKKETKVISIFSRKNILFVSSVAAAIVLFSYKYYEFNK